MAGFEHGFGGMPRRRERIVGFDRLNGIEIADLSDRLGEIWPEDGSDVDRISEVRELIDVLATSSERLGRIVVDLRAEIARIEQLGPTPE